MAERIILDTNIFLNVSNREENFYTASKKLLDKIDSGAVDAIVSMITIAELSTGYRLTGEEKQWEKTLLHLLSSENYKVVDMDVNVADKTGEIRSKTRLTIPDAIIVASGLIHNAGFIVTNDSDFSRVVKDLGVVTPSEYNEIMEK